MVQDSNEIVLHILGDVNVELDDDGLVAALDRFLLNDGLFLHDGVSHHVAQNGLEVTRLENLVKLVEVNMLGFQTAAIAISRQQGALVLLSNGGQDDAHDVGFLTVGLISIHGLLHGEKQVQNGEATILIRLGVLGSRQ